MPTPLNHQIIPAQRRGFRTAALVLVVLSWTLGAHAAFGGGTPRPGQPVGARLLAALHHASRAGLAYDAKISANPLSSISGPPIAADTKAGLLYMGADFCPYCASLRWPLVLSLLRFGHFHNLRYMRSSASDVDANTITFSFHGARYTSRYLALQSVELEDRQQQRLEKPGRRQVALFRKFDAPPYARQRGSIPFLYIGGRYLETGAPFSPGLLKNLSWRQAAKRLTQKNTALGHQVMGATNLYTAALCRLTQNKPAPVCTASGVKAAAANLPEAD